jgi:hypothetical protein
MHDKLYEGYIRLMVWLGAAPPPGYEYLTHGESGKPSPYTVQKKDTLYSIGRKFRVPGDLIAKANALKPSDKLKPGQKLLIPLKNWDPSSGPLVKAKPKPPVVVEKPAPPPPPPVVVEKPAPPPPVVVVEEKVEEEEVEEKEVPPPPPPVVVVEEEVEEEELPLPPFTELEEEAVEEKEVPLPPPPVVVVEEKVEEEELPLPPPPPKPQPTDPTFPPIGSLEAVRALYISYFALSHTDFRQRIFDLLEHTEFNAVVMDVKGDYGWISYPTQIPLAHEIGAARPSAKDFVALMAQLKARRVYTIARIVTFKDNPLSTGRPEYGVKLKGRNELWRDREGLAWSDPALEPVWDYNIQVAIEAARLGFNEVQFDYVRYPLNNTGHEPEFSQPFTKESRTAAIAGFLSAAKGQVNLYGAKVAANTLGYTCWRKDDSMVGQDIDQMGPYLDVLCPMLYPSTFSSGIPGYKVAIAHPYEIVYESALRAAGRVAPLGCAVRPWIQDFQDYRFDKRLYGRTEIQAQIKGCFDARSAGFMAWDPAVQYTNGAYAPVKGFP